jgi:hypothetical protein
VTDAFNTCLQAMVADTSLGVSGGVLSQAASLIKASCFKQGARTLSGALVPLAADMPAPTNFNFVAGDYNRRTGLGDPVNASKYLNSNRNNNADPQNLRHLSVFVSTAESTGTGRQYIGTQDLVGGSLCGRSGITTNLFGSLSNVSGAAFTGRGAHTGFIGLARSDSSSITMRSAGTEATNSAASQTPRDESVFVFARPGGAPAQAYTNARISFYSQGSTLSLAILDARITALSAAIQAAIAP